MLYLVISGCISCLICSCEKVFQDCNSWFLQVISRRGSCFWLCHSPRIWSSWERGSGDTSWATKVWMALMRFHNGCHSLSVKWKLKYLLFWMMCGHSQCWTSLCWKFLAANSLWYPDLTSQQFLMPLIMWNCWVNMTPFLCSVTMLLDRNQFLWVLMWVWWSR